MVPYIVTSLPFRSFFQAADRSSGHRIAGCQSSSTPSSAEVAQGIVIGEIRCDKLHKHTVPLTALTKFSEVLE